MKRAFDITASFLGLLLLFPVFIIVAGMLKLQDGHVLFKQERVGLGGKRFWVLKFRTMVDDNSRRSLQVTSENDVRITTLGKFLRKTKLDELPQLYNVLVGEMSLVGPRPEVPQYVAIWPEEDRTIVLSVRPGITDYATLYYHDEQAFVARSEDPETTYIHEIIPHKLMMYRDYVKNKSFGLDMRLIMATLAKMINGRSLN